MNNNILLTGDVNLVLYNDMNQIKTQRNITNRIVNTGLIYIINRMYRNDVAIAEYIALGTNSNSVLQGNTTLGSELSGSRQQASIAKNESLFKITYATTIPAGVATGIISEAGIFDSNLFNVGTMLCRTVFTGIDKTVDDTLAVSWTLSFSTP